MVDTICALATAPGRAAVAVVRLSGPATLEVLARLGIARPRPRYAALRNLRGEAGALLDRSLVLWFPGPRSYTGEDCAELHIHGGSSVVDGVLGAVMASGARLARPGEFTRRAFENGTLELGQAEAVADLVDAETRAQARQALGQLRGGLDRRYQAWRQRLVSVLASLEAAVDFPDEEVPADVARRAGGPLGVLVAELDEALADGLRGRRIRDGYRIGIIGAPNAGKSSLLNALTGRDTAIVTAVPGATRDVIEVPLQLNGYGVVLADMAGLRDAAEEVEAEGVRRARVWAAEADLRLWVIDQAGSGDGWKMAAALACAGDVAIVNKQDLPASKDGLAARAWALERGLEVWGGSLVRGWGEEIRRGLSERVSGELSGADFPATTRGRHGILLGAAREDLRRALSALEEPELAAEAVRMAIRNLAMVTGAVGTEAVLDEVFGQFCIGK